MRIAQLIDELRLAGGAERLQRSFAEAVRDRDVELTVATLHDNEPEAERELEALGVRVVRLAAPRFLSPGRAARLVRWLRRERFDVLHAHLVRSTVLGGLAARAAGIPCVATLHNTRPNRRLPRSLRAAETFVLRHCADRVVAVGWETARAHRERLRDRSIDVIPNAVPEGERLTDAERRALRAELGVPDGAPLVIAVGRLHPQKAFPDLLRAFARLGDRDPAPQLRIAGRGRERAALEAEIERLGLRDRVRLLGLRLDVPRLLAASDLYVSSADWEGLPVATLEAMASGLPVVATRVGDVPMIVDAEVGALTEPGRPDELAAAIARLLDDPAGRKALGEAARRRAHDGFGVEAWAGKLLRLYDEMRAGGPAGRPGEEHPCASRW